MDLAKKLGKSQAWVSRRLRGGDVDGGTFQIEDLEPIAYVFGLSPVQLLSGEGLERRRGEERRVRDRRVGRQFLRGEQTMAADD
jgi:transcriptional regulator with XRE-family HTH domain